MDEFDEDEVRVTIPARKFRFIDLVIAGLEDFNSFMDDVKYLLCQHANWRNDRERFIREASADIERIVSGEL